MSSIKTVQGLKSLGMVELHRTAADPLPDQFTPGKVFVSVHFRINTPAYAGHGTGSPHFPSGEASDLFYERAYKALGGVGFICDGQRAKSQGETPEDLFIHPDSFSGLVALDKVPAILAAIEEMEGSSLRWVDVYGAPELLDDEEKQLRLEHYEPEMIRRALKTLFTGRKAKFRSINLLGMLTDTGGLPGVQFFEDCSSGAARSSFVDHYMAGLMTRLVSEGLVKTYLKDGITYYRSALKGELKSIPKGARSADWDCAESVLEAA